MMFVRPCYFGEFPLMFAACHNQFNIVRLLMQYSRQRQHPGSKPMQEWQDANGNNVLHMMVISGLKVCVCVCVCVCDNFVMP